MCHGLDIQRRGEFRHFSVFRRGGDIWGLGLGVERTKVRGKAPRLHTPHFFSFSENMNPLFDMNNCMDGCHHYDTDQKAKYQKKEFRTETVSLNFIFYFLFFVYFEEALSFQ